MCPVRVGFGGTSPDADAPGPAQTGGGAGETCGDVARQDAKIGGPRRRVQASARLRDQRFKNDKAKEYFDLWEADRDTGLGEVVRGAVDLGQGALEEEIVG